MDEMLMGAPAEPEKMIPREAPEVDPARAALIKGMIDEVLEAREYWKKKRFDRMKADMQFARGKQWDAKQTYDDERYVANIVSRHIQQRTAALYAKNPKVTFKRRPRLDFQVWDGSQEQLQRAQQTMQAASGAVSIDPATGAQVQAPPPSPEALMEAQAILTDIQQGKAHRQMIDKIGRTLVTVFDYSIGEPKPKFKPQAKQAVRRALTVGTAYCKLGYQRLFDQTPDTDSQIKDASERLAELQRLAQDVADDQIQEGDKEMAELKIKLEQLQNSPALATREGLTFGFPDPKTIIVDPKVQQLKGFIGAGWVAEEYCYTPDRVKEIFHVDVKGSFTPYNKDRNKADKPDKDSYAMVFAYYDLTGQIIYYLCDGYPDALKAPGEGNVHIEQFPPLYVLSFNDAEDDEDPYADSNVHSLRPMQREINRVQEAKRQHRISSLPGWVAPAGTFGVDEKVSLATRQMHEVVELPGVKQGTDIKTVLQPIPTQQMDPTLYETDSVFMDALRVSGDQEANFGGTSDSTATESTIAENTRMSTLESNKDDLDEWLSDIAEGAGQILLMNLPKEKAMEIAGPGAVWPEMAREEIMKQVYLEVAAGSTGRPNKALDIANTERIMPFVVQVPGINPEHMAKKLVRLMDDDAEWEDALAAGVPSITALNGMTQASTGDPSTDPNSQGGEGANNAPQQSRPQPASQSQFPVGQ